MNGLDLYNFMYDQFVWPQHPFASRDVRHREGSSVSQEAAGEPSPCRRGKNRSGQGIGEEHPNLPESWKPVPRVVIVLADQRKKTT